MKWTLRIVINWPNTNWSLKSIFVGFTRSFDQFIALYEWFYSKVLPAATDKDLMHPRKWTQSVALESAGWQYLMGPAEQDLIKEMWGFDWRQIPKLSLPGMNNPHCCRVEICWTLVAVPNAFHCNTGILCLFFFFLKEAMSLILRVKGCSIDKPFPLYWMVLGTLLLQQGLTQQWQREKALKGMIRDRVNSSTEHLVEQWVEELPAHLSQG